MILSRLICEAADAAAANPTPVSPADVVSGSSVVSGADVVSSGTVSSTVVSAADLGGAATMSVGSVIGICIFVFVLLMIAFEIIRSRYVLSVTHREVVLEDLPEAFDGTRIAVISDLRQMRFGDFNEELAKHIRREFPDYVFFAGDMGDAKKFNVDAFYDLVDSLGNDIPVIMVPGRDDLRIGGGAVHRNFLKEVEHAGGLMLNNSCAELLSGKSKLYVYGFCPPLEPQEDVSALEWDYASVDEGDLPAMLGRCPSDAPVILLAHDPRPFEAYCKWGAQLVLCGYTHGGLVRLPHFGGLLPVDEGKLFPQYAGGEYVHDGTRMIVTRGLGTPKGLRFLNAPEISMITLSLPEHRKPAVAEPEEEAALRKENRMTFAEKAKNQAAIITDWAKGETRSLRELLYERSIQIRDFFSLMFGKKRSRFAKAADEKKRSNTYVAPKQPRKQTPDRSRRSGGQFAVKPAKRIDSDGERFGTDYNSTSMRTDLDDERSDMFRRVDRSERTGDNRSRSGNQNRSGNQGKKPSGNSSGKNSGGKKK